MQETGNICLHFKKEKGNKNVVKYGFVIWKECLVALFVKQFFFLTFIALSMY